MMAGKKPMKLSDKAREKMEKGMNKVMPGRKKLLDALDMKKKK